MQVARILTVPCLDSSRGSCGVSSLSFAITESPRSWFLRPERLLPGRTRQETLGAHAFSASPRLSPETIRP